MPRQGFNYPRISLMSTIARLELVEISVGTKTEESGIGVSAAFPFVRTFSSGIVNEMERRDAEWIAAVLKGDATSFEPLIQKYSPRVFASVRRYARRDSEIEDIAQEVWLKAYSKLSSFRGDAPFEHWLMRLTVRT